MAVQETIRVDVDAVVNGFEKVRAFVNELRGLRSTQKVSLNTDGAEKPLGRLLQLVRNLSPAADTVVSKVQNVTKPIVDLGKDLAGTGTAAAGATVGVGALTLALGGLLAVTLAIAGGIAILGFFVNLAVGAAEADSKIHDLSQELAVSVETLSALQAATHTTSTSFEETAAGVSKFNKLIGEAADGSKEAARDLTRLGVDPQKALKDNEAALAAVFKRIHELPTPYEKARAAQIAFGKSGANMVPVIDAVNGSLDEAKKRASEFGTLLTDKAARDADEFGDQLDELKLKAEGFGLSIGRTLIPELLKLLRVFSHDMPGAGNAFEGVLTLIRVKVEELVNEVLVAIAAIKALASLPVALGVAVGTGNVLNAFAVLRDQFVKELGELLSIANTPPTGGGKTGPPLEFGKPGGDKNKRPADTFESRLALSRSGAQQEFELEKDLLDRLKEIYRSAYADRRIDSETFFRNEERLRSQQIQNEIRLQEALARIARERRDEELKRVKKEDEEKTEEQKAADKTNIQNKFFEESSAISIRILTLQRELAAIPGAVETEATAATDAINTEIDSVLTQLDEINGKTRTFSSQIEKLLDSREKLLTTGGKSLLDPLIQAIDVAIEHLRALEQFQDQLKRFDDIDAQRQAKVEVLRASTPNNELAEFRLRQEVNRVNAEYLRLLEQQITALEDRAKQEGAPEKVQSEIAHRRAEVEELKKSVADTELRDTGINALVSGAQQFSSALLTSVHSLKDLKSAALSFAQSFLDALSQIIIKVLLLKALSAIFGGFGGGPAAGSAGSVLGGAAKFATGGDVPATPGGRHIVVAEGGYDEMVVTTDPRHASRTSNLLAAFMTRTGIVPRFSAGSFALSVANSISTVPRLAAGAIVPAPGPSQLAAAAQGSNFAVRNVNLFDPAELLDALQSSSGERVVLNVISKNPARFRAALGLT